MKKGPAGSKLALFSLTVPVGAVAAVLVSAACASSTHATVGANSVPVPSSSAGSSSVIVGDASAMNAGSAEAEIAAYAAATPSPATSSSGAKPKIYKPAVDPAASSPNGKCRSANSPAPEFRAAAMSAAQATLICYEYALKRDAPSPAHLEVMLDVDEDGRLRDAAVLSDDFADDKMRSCTVRKLRETERFPPPQTGCGSVTRLPLTFIRADGGL